MVQYRSNLRAVFTVLKKINLSKELSEELKKTPFYYLLLAVKEGKILQKHCQKKDIFANDFIGHYDKVAKKFKVQGCEIDITRNDIKLIFAIKDGSKKMDPTPEKGNPRKQGVYRSSPFVNRHFMDNIEEEEEKDQKPGLHRKWISDALVEASKRDRKIDREDTARLIVLLLMIALFAPTKNQILAWGYIEYVEDLDSMQQLNWSGHIFEKLTQSLAKGAKDAYGCVMAILYTLCERARVIKPMKEVFPRFTKWNLRRIPISVEDLKIGEVITGPLTPTETELRLLGPMEEKEEQQGETDIGKAEKTYDNEEEETNKKTQQENEERTEKNEQEEQRQQQKRKKRKKETAEKEKMNLNCLYEAVVQNEIAEKLQEEELQKK